MLLRRLNLAVFVIAVITVGHINYLNPTIDSIKWWDNQRPDASPPKDRDPITARTSSSLPRQEALLHPRLGGPRLLVDPFARRLPTPRLIEPHSPEVLAEAAEPPRPVSCRPHLLLEAAEEGGADPPPVVARMDPEEVDGVSGGGRHPHHPSAALASDEAGLSIG